MSTTSAATLHAYPKTQNWSLPAIMVLLLLNLVMTGWLLYRTSLGREPSVRLPSVALADADKVFQLISAFHTEAGNVIATANYPTEEERKSGREYLQKEEMSFQLARIAYAKLKENPTRSTLLAFVSGVCPLGSYCEAVSVPTLDKTTYGHLENEKWVESVTVHYGNPGHLKSMAEDFPVLMNSLLKEVQ